MALAAFAAALNFFTPHFAQAAVTNVLSCGNWGSTIVPTSPAGGSFIGGQTITFSGVVKQMDSLTSSNYKASWSGGVMEFYIMENAKVPLIDACNDENYNQESCLMYSCSQAGDCVTTSPSVPCPMKWPSCKWTPCDSCCGRIQEWCGSSKLPFCDEVDTVRTDGASKVFLLGWYSPSDVSRATSFNYSTTFVLPNVNLSGNARFVVYYRGIMQRWDPFGRAIIAGGTPSKTSAYTWQAAYDTVTYTPCTCGVWTGGACGAGGCAPLKRQQTRTCNPANCQVQSRCVSDSSCCTCSAWANGGCGSGGCGPLQRQQTRSCVSGCQAESQCINDSSCCSCAAWTGGSCGAGGCPANQRQQTRSCSPAGCQSQSQCVADASCEPETITGRVTDNSGRGLDGVTVDTCNGTVTTDANGNFSKNVFNGTAYCARLTAGLPAGYTGIRGTSNNGCYPNWATYEWQIAGQNQFVACGLNDQRSWDLGADNNINFVVDYPVCTCGSWTDGACGSGGCGPLQRQQTRTCNPVGCQAQSQCVNDASCCTCAAWTGGSCGAGGCPANQRQQTRSCSPAGCQPQSQCVADASCETLSVTLAADPAGGTAPLNTTLTATVSGTATGTINYTIWWNCASACTTVAACQSACGSYDLKADGQAAATYSASHTYAAAGMYLPKVVVERGSQSAEDQTSVNVAAATCSCGLWSNSGCGQHGCQQNQMGQARSCNPPACDAETQCVNDAACDDDDGETLAVALDAAPSSGFEPLAVVLTATVSGSASGPVNYTFWWDCDDGCDTVAACQAACGAWGAKADGRAEETYAVNHTFAGGDFAAKVVAERGTKSASATQTVSVTANRPPSVTGGSATQGDYCQASPAATFSWTYSDPDGDAQKYYRVQVSDSPGFASIAADSGKVESSFAGYAVQMGALSYSTTYYWRVAVWDARGAESGWYNGAAFTTPSHAYPAIDFSWIPQKPIIEADITFTASVTVFGGAVEVARQWTFAGATPASSNEENPTVQYASKGDYLATLTVTDSSGFTCTKEKTVGVRRSIPDWEEVF